MPHTIEEWDVSRVGDLVAVTDAAMAGEELSGDELVSVCWEDPVAGSPETGVVLGLADGLGAVSVVWRPPRPSFEEGGAVRPGAFVKLVVVHPDAQRQGRGDALLAAAEAWAWDHGATDLALAGSPPVYLWPGVDATAIEPLCLADARGFQLSGSALNLSLPSSYRAPTPPGVTIRRAITDVDVAAVEVLIRQEWPYWWDEAVRAIEHGCCHVAFTDAGGLPGADPAAPIGFVCHSVCRAGWLGPMATHPRHQGTGIGQALVSAVCRDLMIAEMDRTEICWAGPVRFYAKSGATVSRVFRQYRKVRP